MKYLISIPAGGYKCCAGIGIAIEISKLLSKIKSNITYAGVSSGACIAFIMCHNSSRAYKLKIIKKLIMLETSNNNIFIQLDKKLNIFFCRNFLRIDHLLYQLVLSGRIFFYEGILNNYLLSAICRSKSVACRWM